MAGSKKNNKQKQPELYEIAESETDQSEQVWKSFSVDKIVNDFKAINNMSLNNASLDFGDHVPITKITREDAASSDDSGIEKIVE